MKIKIKITTNVSSSAACGCGKVTQSWINGFRADLREKYFRDATIVQPSQIFRVTRNGALIFSACSDCLANISAAISSK